jgi:hypothetical protein
MYKAANRSVLAATGTGPISFAEFTIQTAKAWKETALS